MSKKDILKEAQEITKRKRTTETMSISVSFDDAEKIREEANKEGVSVSTLFQAMIKSYFKRS